MVQHFERRQAGRAERVVSDSSTVVDVPGVGRVIAVLHTLTFGLSAETVIMLGDVRWPDGRLASCEDHERTAAYLEDAGRL
ncbi:hypothetical protein [Microbacterium enclense]|uniref:hypothetical protein n=1 Tax=Microbacterium enclense TaxID=993073 RepID=UPI00344ACAA4